MNTATKKIRNSETRNRIYEYLCGTKEHPSADTIYSDLRGTVPSLSKGTVYNNLKHFESQGMVIRVANVNGIERYDANTEDHVHFVCEKCGRVIDLMDVDVETVKATCSTTQGAKIKHIQIVLHGTCEACSDD